MEGDTGGVRVGGLRSSGAAFEGCLRHSAAPKQVLSKFNDSSECGQRIRPFWSPVSRISLVYPAMLSTSQDASRPNSDFLTTMVDCKVGPGVGDNYSFL